MVLHKSIDSKMFQHGGEGGGACSHNSIHANITSHTITDLRVKADVQAKARELADLLAQSEEVTQYRKAEAKIQNHERVQGLIAQIKKKQKEAVAFEHTFKNSDMVKKLKLKLINCRMS